jgi:phospholipase C
MDHFSRRGFLGGVAGAASLAGLTALGVAGCGSSDKSASSATTLQPGTGRLPNPADAPFDTVVVVMMENRSFDAMLGWLPGANGKQAGLNYLDSTGKSYPTWHLAPDWQGCQYQDPFHLWQSVQLQFNDGKIDGFLQTQPVGDQFPIGYYEEADLPILGTLAQNYTTFDNYFCSMLGPTWPNRFYQLCATTDLDYTGNFPKPGEPRPSNLQTAIFDRTNAANLSSAYYSPGEPMTGLFSSKKYDDLTHPYTQFLSDASAGKLPNVSFVDPNYTAEAEFNGTSNDDHPYGSVQAGEAFLAEVHDAIVKSPQWGRTVMVVNFDEHGGFFDSVVPPAVQDDTVLPGTGPFPNLKNLGFRVPAVVVSPFAPKKIEQAGPYEHCSVLKMIEWRWGLPSMTVRDANAKNLADALDFSTTRAPVTLPAFTPATAEVCTNTKHFA